MNPFVIRPQQLHSLRGAREEGFLQEMVEHLRAHFPERTAGLGAPVLKHRVERELHAARGHGLETRLQLCRFLNLCGVYGWNFAQQPRNAWMKTVLTAPDLPTPGARLDRLVEQCLHRLEVQARRARLAREFGLQEGA
jgi:hypothetical protein